MKILIWGEIKKGGPYDIFRQLDYKSIYAELVESYHANSINVGNKVWIQGIVSALCTSDNELYFYNPTETWEEINDKYDKIVYSAANMLSSSYLDLIDSAAELFKGSRLPVYVIAIGAQANVYEDLSQLLKDTSKSVAKFMDSVYSTGGEIACRGYFTKEYLDKIASNSAVVTGCPSLFQNGRNLHITKHDTHCVPVFNGNAPFGRLSVQYKQSVYIDQGDYLNLTYSLHDYNIRRYLANTIAKFGEKETELFLDGRIKIFYDMPEWRMFLKKGNFNFSVGSRIHGNIMSLLNGIPAAIRPIDTRTREMAEFYNIPIISSDEEYINLECMYESISYDRFNTEFPKLFDTYNDFLKKCGLVKEVNQNNIFWNRNMPKNIELLEEKRIGLKYRMDNISVCDKLFFKFARKHPKIARMNDVEPSAIVEEYNKE